MAPQEKKWTDAAERDLCVSIIYSHQSRYDWSRVTTIMEGLGYTFTKDAMTYVTNPLSHSALPSSTSLLHLLSTTSRSVKQEASDTHKANHNTNSQHLSKSILRAFKDRCTDEVIAAAEATPPASATKPKATPRKGAASTPRKRTKNGVKGQAAADAGDNNNDEVDDEMALDATPTKKLKKEDKVKKEEKEKVKKEEAPATPTAAAADQRYVITPKSPLSSSSPLVVLSET